MSAAAQIAAERLHDIEDAVVKEFYHHGARSEAYGSMKLYEEFRSRVDAATRLFAADLTGRN
jgi:hypothetical protein